MLSVLNLMILRLDMDSVEDFADFGSAGANSGDSSRKSALATGDRARPAFGGEHIFETRANGEQPFALKIVVFL